MEKNKKQLKNSPNKAEKVRVLIKDEDLKKVTGGASMGRLRIN